MLKHEQIIGNSGRTMYLPEHQYWINPNMSMAKLSQAYLDGSSISGQVTKLDVKKDRFEVYLGNQIFAYMYVKDSTIYDVYKENNFSPKIYALIGKTIRAKVISLKNGILLSRKNNMLEALAHIKDCKSFSSATITAFSNLNAYIDVGAGISGKILAREFSPVFFKNIRDVGLRVNNTIPVQVLDFDSTNQRFYLSRLKAIPPFWEHVNPSDSVVCKVFDPLPNDDLGYHVLINYSIAGILDSPIQLEYGDMVVGYVKKVNRERQGPQLNFVSKL